MSIYDQIEAIREQIAQEREEARKENLRKTYRLLFAADPQEKEEDHDTTAHAVPHTHAE